MPLKNPIANSTGTVRPDPDPTLRTTEQVLREIEHLKEWTGIRFEENDKAVKLLQELANKSPTIGELHQMVISNKVLMEMKFQAVQDQLKERDTRKEQSERDSKNAVDAALTAAKEAVGKTELSFTKQLDQIGIQIQTMAKSIDDKVDDIKNRVIAVESGKTGGTQSWTWIAVIGAIALLAMFVLFGEGKPNG